MKWIRITAVLLVVIFLSACSTNPGTVPTTPTEEIAENIFTSPPEMETETDETDNGVDIGTIWKGFAPDKNEMEGENIVYSGGETCVTFKMGVTGKLREIGVGLLLLLDGNPQPYKLSEDGELAYIHQLPMEDGPYYELMFTPVTGKAGDVLELDVIHLVNLNYYLGRAEENGINLRQTMGASCKSTQMVFKADPPEAELPEIPERVIEQNITNVDLTSVDMRGWTSEQLQKDSSFKMTTDNKIKGGWMFGVTPEAELIVRAEVFGCPAADWSFLVYVGHQPVSVRPENRIFFQTQNGKKTVIEVKLDLSDFDGEEIMYAVLCLRNDWDLLSMDVGNISTEITETCYLTDAVNQEAVLEKYGIG